MVSELNILKKNGNIFVMKKLLTTKEINEKTISKSF